MSATKLLANSETVGEILGGLSETTVKKMNEQGLMPMPVAMKIRRTLWSVRELDAWIQSGCPSRVEWEGMKGK